MVRVNGTDACSPENLALLRNDMYGVPPLARLLIGWADPEVRRLFGDQVRLLIENSGMRAAAEALNFDVPAMVRWYLHERQSETPTDT
jgi:hypothetical protein